MPSSATPLFRYVAVRPAQTHNLQRESVRFMRPPLELTKLQNQLKDSKNWDAARKIARPFVNSRTWLGAQLETDSRLIGLRIVYGEMKAALESNQEAGLRAHVKKLLESDMTTTAVADLRDDIWDSLIATYLVPRVRPRDRAGLIDCLRALLFIQQIAEADASDLRDIVRATPLIPNWIGTGPGKLPPGNLPGTTPTVRNAGEASLETVRALRRQVLRIDVACDDLELTYSRARLAARNQSAGTEPPKAIAGGVKILRQISSEPQSAGLTNRVVDRAKLEKSTTALLDGLDPVWESRSQDDTLERLQARRAATMAQLSRVGGAAALADLEVRTVPMDRDDISIDDFEWPTQGIPAVGGFTGSIEGSVGEVRPVGVGDLLIVQESLLGYEEGEIADVQNVMSTESMSRTFRKLDRTTTTTFSSSTTTETSERDLQSTQRYELQSEASETLTSETSIDTGVNVSASYGPMVQVDASADFSVDSTSESSTTTASNFAQDIVDKSVSKLTQSLKEEITVRVLSETEETANHGFENQSGEHVIGIYRWLNKRCQAQVHNYGRRLLIEFRVPEPSAFYKHARASGLAGDPSLQPPPPLEEDFSFESIEPDNYSEWIGRYHVDGVTPAPPKSRVVTKVIDIPQPMDQGGIDVLTRSDSIAVPTGYVAKECWAHHAGIVGESPWLNLVIGQHLLSSNTHTELDDEEASVPLGVSAINYSSVVITFEVRCERTTETLKAWKLDTYQKIVDAYDALKSEYDAAVKAREVSESSAFSGLAPEAKRTIELTELKKGCLELLSDQYFYDFDATVANASPFGYPEFKVAEAMIEGGFAQFFEQCFEWENTTWFYYPYFWGRKDQWIQNGLATDSDPVFESFLRAGMARVQVPVRPGYGKALLYYLHTGEIWNGGEPPVLDSPLYVSLVEEIAESQDVSLADAPVYGDPWSYSLPTTLVKLQADATLPEWPAP